VDVAVSSEVSEGLRVEEASEEDEEGEDEETAPLLERSGEPQLERMPTNKRAGPT
jgi:hypothetical protein